ncbi:MAG: hypothetical protein M0Q38_00135 [Bacteroidales bacterium]|jgi:hypothetical protein|nr:hypothetical protein [Bacteroidales bacterium]
MKKLNILLILFALLLSYCTKEDKPEPEAELSVLGFYSYCNTDSNKCGKPLNHEGSYVTIIGYVQALNRFENGNRFHLFDSASITSQRVEIKVVDNNSSIFEKLNKNLDNINIENFTKFRVTGRIIGHDLYTNGACLRNASMEINSSDDISKSL